MLSANGRFAVRVAADVYRGILGRIEASDYDVFERRVVVPSVQKYWITARCMAVPIAVHSVGKLVFWRA
jgi:phytoene/squalene synthetase